MDFSEKTPFPKDPFFPNPKNNFQIEEVSLLERLGALCITEICFRTCISFQGRQSPGQYALQRAPNAPEFAHPSLSRSNPRSSFPCFWDFLVFCFSRNSLFFECFRFSKDLRGSAITENLFFGWFSLSFPGKARKRRSGTSPRALYSALSSAPRFGPALSEARFRHFSWPGLRHFRQDCKFSIGQERSHHRMHACWFMAVGPVEPCVHRRRE